MNNKYLLVKASGNSSEDLLTNLLQQTDASNFYASLGFVYATDLVVNDLDLIMHKLQMHFNVENWVGTIGVGICCTGEEYYEEHAIVMLLTNGLNHHLFMEAGTMQIADVPAPSFNSDTPSLAVIHGSPAQENLMATFQHLYEAMPSSYFVGGLTSSSSAQALQVFNGVIKPAFSGVVIDDSSQVVVGHTQGCEPIGKTHLITKAEDNRVIELDHRPALEVMKEDIGEVLARDLQQIAGYIFVGFPIEHTDTNDYLVRNIIGFDTKEMSIFVGDYITAGSAMMFCRRDGNSAVVDMQRMLDDITSRLTKPARGALYFSCLARGRNQFGENAEELKMIEKHLGNVPLVGFFANGEILHQRLYGYTGVLTIFT